MAGYLWAGGQRDKIEDKPKQLVMTTKQERDAKFFGVKKPKEYKIRESVNDEPFEIWHQNWQYWKLFKAVNDEFKWLSVPLGKKVGLLRTGIDGTAVISYLNLTKTQRKKRAFKMIKHIATGVKQADRDKLSA